MSLSLVCSYCKSKVSEVDANGHCPSCAIFLLEEQARITSEKQGAIHDCNIALCSKDLDNKPITANTITVNGRVQAAPPPPPPPGP